MRRSAKRIFISLLFLSPFYGLLSQPVLNDSIKNKKELIVNSTFYPSTTAGCTLEWECIDKKAVENIVTFHNDQWFYFTTVDSGSYFLNIKNQLCRDKRGVQVLLIDGIPCSPSTYKYLKLHSMLSIQDIYYELKNLKKAHTYLISIDGLLGDYCNFEISLTDSPPDYELILFSKDLDSRTNLNDKIFNLYWNYKKMPGDSIIGFEVYKKYGNANYIPAYKIPVRDFTFKSDTIYYQFADSLNEFGDYNYLLLANTIDKKHLVNSFAFNYFPDISNGIKKSKNTFKFRSRHRKSKQIEVVISDYQTQRIFERRRFENIFNRNYAIDLSKYSNKNINKIKIEVFYSGGKEKKSIYFKNIR